jgi:NitT/TauT family transport system substrate-binding protein
MILRQAHLGDRRAVLRGIAALCAVGPALARGAAAGEAAPLTLWGIPATPSAVFARAAASATLQAASPGARFDVWKSTDQMRAGVASGAFGLFATSTYAAANFFNRGAGTRMVNVVTWGVLHVMARDDSIRGVDDLAGRTVLLSNKHEAPDLLFRLLLGWSGLDPDRDVTLDYVGSPGEAVPLYLAGRGNVAVLHEPAATAALLRARQEGIAIVRALDVTDLYRRHTGRPAGIPQVGLAASARLVETEPEVVAAAHAACVEAGAWVRAHPDEAAAAAGPALGLPAPVIAASLPHVHLDVVSAQAAREDIEVYFRHLMELAPGIVGGRLPDPGFYWG